MVWFFIILAIIIAILIVVCFFVSNKLFVYAIVRKDKDGQVTREELEKQGVGEFADEILKSRADFFNTQYREVEITSYDGLKLFGRYYHLADGAPVEILVHGYRGNAIRDFCGGCKLAMDAGHNVLLIDQRAHGNSQGKTICFGIKEKYDVQSWANYVVDRFGKDVKIILAGVSMGAATVMETLSLDLPDNVVGVIADCGYSSTEEIIRKVCKEMKFPPKITMPFVKLGAVIYGRLKIEGGALDAAKKDLNSAKKQLDDSLKQIKESEKTIKDGKKQIKKARIT